MADNTVNTISGSKVFELNKFDKLISLNNPDYNSNYINDDEKHEFYKIIIAFANVHPNELDKIQYIIDYEFFNILNYYTKKVIIKESIGYNSGIKYIFENVINPNKHNYNIDVLLLEHINWTDMNFNNINDAIKFTNEYIKLGFNINYRYFEDIRDEYKLNILVLLYDAIKYTDLYKYIDYLRNIGFSNYNLILFIECLYDDPIDYLYEYYKIKDYIKNKYGIHTNNKKLYNGLIEYKNNIGNKTNIHKYNEILDYLSS